MNAHDEEGGFELLASVRQLERRLRRLKSEWRSFRNEPSGPALEVVRSQVARMAAELREMSAALGVSSGGGRRGLAQDPLLTSETQTRPAARDVVQASRDLDAWIWQAARGWKEVIEDPTAERLRGLVQILVRCARRSNTLLGALGGSAPLEGALRASSPAVPVGSAADRIEAQSRELEALVWRLQADWHHVRRAPTVDRIRILQSELAEAAARTESLRQDVGTAGNTAFRRALRVGYHSADTVRFLPYRDPFTGVYNREGFDALAAAELKRCRRYGRRFGLLVLRVSPPDLESLRSLVAAARAELRAYDLIARYAQDVLVVGIPEGGSGATRRVASRILKAMRRAGVAESFKALAYSTLPEDGSTLSGLLDSATSRLDGPPGGQQDPQRQPPA